MNREKWKTVSIKSVYHGLYDGPHATPSPCAVGPVFLGIKNVTDDGALDLTDIRHISEIDFPRWTKRVNPQPGDIVFTYEATLNRYAIVPDGFRGCLGRRMALIRTNPEKIDTRFLHFYFFSKQWREVISNNTLTGATVDRIPLTKFPDFPVTIPDLPTQREIAGILSAYDDLIENNQRRIKILEEMAQSLYREWFVHFRFPGHESARFTASPLGQIPEGWEVKPLFEVAAVKYGKMLPKKDLAEDGPFPVYGAAKVIGRHTSFTREDRTIICGCRGSVGEMQITEPRCFVTNNSFTFDPVSPNIYFWLFYTLSARGLRDVTGGAAQPQITLDGISQVSLGVPPEFILAQFEKRSRVLAELAWNLKSKNQTLRRTRDLLLPKLLSGDQNLDESRP